MENLKDTTTTTTMESEAAETVETMQTTVTRRDAIKQNTERRLQGAKMGINKESQIRREKRRMFLYPAMALLVAAGLIVSAGFSEAFFERLNDLWPAVTFFGLIGGIIIILSYYGAISGRLKELCPVIALLLLCGLMVSVALYYQPICGYINNWWISITRAAGSQYFP